MVSLRVLTFACAATTEEDARFWMFFAVSVARCLECTRNQKNDSHEVVCVNEHKHVAALKLVELSVGIIQNLIF
jgi:hypothetical protein